MACRLHISRGYRHRTRAGRCLVCQRSPREGIHELSHELIIRQDTNKRWRGQGRPGDGGGGGHMGRAKKSAARMWRSDAFTSGAYTHTHTHTHTHKCLYIGTTLTSGYLGTSFTTGHFTSSLCVCACAYIYSYDIYY